MVENNQSEKIMKSSRVASLAALRNSTSAVFTFGFLFGVAVLILLLALLTSFAIQSSFIVLIVGCLLVRKWSFAVGSILGAFVGFVFILLLAVSVSIG